MASPVAAALAFSPSGYASELSFDYELRIDMDCVQRNIRVSTSEEEGGDDNRSSGGDTSGGLALLLQRGASATNLPALAIRFNLPQPHGTSA